MAVTEMIAIALAARRLSCQSGKVLTQCIVSQTVVSQERDSHHTDPLSGDSVAPQICLTNCNESQVAGPVTTASD